MEQQGLGSHEKLKREEGREERERDSSFVPRPQTKDIRSPSPSLAKQDSQCPELIVGMNENQFCLNKFQTSST